MHQVLWLPLLGFAAQLPAQAPAPGPIQSHDGAPPPVVSQPAEQPAPKPLNSHSTPPLPRVDFTLRLDVVSQYNFRGRDVYDDRPAFQPSMVFSLPDAFVSFKLWGSMCPVNRDEKFIRVRDEFDFTAVFRPRIGPFDLGIGHTSFVFPNSDKLALNTAEFFADFRYHTPTPQPAFITCSLFAFVSYDYDRGNGLYARAGVDAALRPYVTRELALEFPIGGHMGYNNAEFEAKISISDTDFYAGVRLTAWNFFLSVTGHFTITPEATVNPHDEHEWWGIISIGATF